MQGETTYAGLPCSFVRFCGCNLRCSYCDTRYAYSEGKEMTVNEVLAEVSKLHCSLITITGGEPLLQEEVLPLIDELILRGCRVLVETNGSLSVSRLSPDVVKVVDLKCPDSGMCDKMDWANISRLQKHDEVKFVISSEKDYDWARSVTDKYKLNEKLTVLMSPVWGRLALDKLAGWILADEINVRLQPQLHKFIWGHENFNAVGV